VGIQLMVHSDEAVSGVAFTIDTETGFDKVIEILKENSLIIEKNVRIMVYHDNYLHFPKFNASSTAEQMADYIAKFALEGQKLFNGKIIPIVYIIL